MAPNVPWSLLVVNAAVLSFLLVQYAPEFSVGQSLIWNFCTLFLVEASARYVWAGILWPKLFSPLRHLPQAPGGSFFNGQFWNVMKQDTGIPMREWINTIPNDGLIRYLMIGNAERVFVTNPKSIGEVLQTKSYDYVKPALARQALGRLLGVGVLLAEGEEHKTQRKNLMPAFHYRHIKDLYPTFWNKSGEMVNVVTEMIHSKGANDEKVKEEGLVLDFAGWLNRATLDIIGLAGMGFDFNAIHDPNNELNNTYRAVFTPSRQARLMGLASLFIPIWLIRLLPFKRNTDIATAAQKVRQVSRELIVKKQQQMSEKGTSVGKDILSVALDSGGFTVENLVDQTMTFLAAGHETTATATQWALIELARHPEVQTRLREEIRNKLPSINETAPMTSDLVDELPYLHAVCNEVLRFWAPVPFTRRESARDTTILGQVIPKGTDVVLVPYAVNYSKAMWGEDADQFNPDRWMGEKRANSGGAESNYANLTFLHGPRGCIGQAFAKAEFNCLLAAVVGRFEFEMVPKDRELKIEMGIVARPKGGLELKMKPLDGW